MNVIDSNIWAYYFDATLPEHKSVIEFLDPLLKQNNIVVTTRIVLEVVHFLFKRLGPIVGFEKASIFQMGNFKILDFTTGDLTEHLELMKRVTHSGLGSRDVSILVCMKRENLSKIVTHDKAFQQIDGIEVIDPVGVLK